MRLKCLELHGFKSFADKTKIDFHSGVTGIVGPNGCGKSNVVDGVRWALGETSAKALRGGEMADVIFNGTDKRKPHSMAEVSLTFSDCESSLGVDFNEICITRRVYRDGKSEYEMNGTTCRLKDINKMFMDTGVGRSAYSIMEQGKIDMLLSAKPEDRRQVFEEAAGITKSKSEKKEALRKLEYTEANLLRVTDVLVEMKRQMEAQKAQQAAELKMQEMALKQAEMEQQRQLAEQQAMQASMQAAQKMEQDREMHAQTLAKEDEKIAIEKQMAQIKSALMVSEQENSQRMAEREANDRTTQQSSSDALAASLAAVVDRLSTAATAPKRILRDANGKATGVESVNDSAPSSSSAPKPKSKSKKD
jgi:chromosome segregation protein